MILCEELPVLDLPSREQGEASDELRLSGWSARWRFRQGETLG